jgi:tRNA threonylcarbamoyladenosine biosynthesis protein TsaE
MTRGVSLAPVRLVYDLPDPGATEVPAQRIAPILGAGDTLLLAGPIGAGKTHFARALIRARLGREEEVPSPTYTLVQTYRDGGTEVWHADLYRLTDPGEVTELGLEEAFESAICLVEWPERLASAPPGALALTFSVEGEGRRLVAEGPEAWSGRMPQAQDA